MLGIAEHGLGVGKRRLVELERIGTRREIVDRVGTEVWQEHECVGAGAAVEDIVRPADERCGAADSGERLTTRASVQHETNVPIAVEVLLETGLERLQRGARSRRDVKST